MEKRKRLVAINKEDYEKIKQTIDSCQRTLKFLTYAFSINVLLMMLVIIYMCVGVK